MYSANPRDRDRRQEPRWPTWVLEVVVFAVLTALLVIAVLWESSRTDAGTSDDHGVDVARGSSASSSGIHAAMTVPGIPGTASCSVPMAFWRESPTTRPNLLP